MSTRTPMGHDLVERIAALDMIDEPAKKLAKAVRDLKQPKEINEALSGTWLGHPAHPLLILLPMGSWISAVLLDWLGGEDAETGADLLIGAGLLSAVPTVATGYSDWADTEPASDSVRRVGAVHAAFNATAAGLFGASLAARVNGARGRGKLLALAGLGAVGVGGFLGGHLTYAEGVGVNMSTFETYPEDWTPVLDDGDLPDGALRQVDVDGTTILLARTQGRVHALSNTCMHRGGRLDQGELQNGCVTCPVHGSVYRLENGSVERGPAAYPQPVLEARIRDGSIEVRAPQRP
ncbi:MAG TPA: Rieske (2Fe-2S) protein [Solirubrobacteraceae bacterium]|nr:Rieske (2Fe-2S) protein [Solirubrobacteraceae bacterium]